MADDVRPTHVSLGQSRPVLKRIHELLGQRPDLAERYEAAKLVVRAFRKPAFYEVTQRCNLWCEGCYFFEGGLSEPVTEQSSVDAWEGFFASQADEGVSMAYFVGAEPALEQERLFAANRHFPYGAVGTNGTIKIDPAIQYRITVSVWAGDEETDKKLRGGSVFRKALRNYAGDQRTIVLYTLSPWNLAGARTVAQMCEDAGITMTFNMYSPTFTYLAKLKNFRGNDNRFFRVSRPDDTPCFSEDDLVETRKVVRGLMEEFPQTVVYSSAYNDWITRPGPLYELDPETGNATRCGARVIGQMKYYKADLSVSAPKCCTPDIDCSQCRMYNGGWPTNFQPTLDNVACADTFCDWMDMMEALGRIMLYRAPGQAAVSSREPAALAAAV